MAYIQINIGGRVRGMTFNFATDEEYRKKYGESDNSTFASYCLVWAALVSDCFVEGTHLTHTVDGLEIPASFRDVIDWCSTLTVDDLKAIQTAHDEAHAFLKDIPKEDEDPTKKNLVQENTERSVEGLSSDS